MPLNDEYRHAFIRRRRTRIGGGASAGLTFAGGDIITFDWADGAEPANDDTDAPATLTWWDNSSADAANPTNSGGYGYHDGSFDTDSVAGRSGYYASADLFTTADITTNGIDVELTFKWLAAADTTNSVFGPTVTDDPTGTTNNEEPGEVGVRVDRNFNRIGPGRYRTRDGISNFAQMTGATLNHTLAGAELTADDSTDHTVGFKITWDGSAWDYTAYFDGVVQAENPLNVNTASTEDGILDTIVRLGVGYEYAAFTAVTERFKTLKYGHAGTLY
jgi:hypothetical protein